MTRAASGWMRVWIPWLLALAGCVLVISTVTGLATGTPMYAARAGRTCDNCHLDPGRWVNPELSQRKCTLSCQSCHIDPAGGGLRNAAGRFYGRSTLPMRATSPRPTQDWDREFLGLWYRPDAATTYNDDIPRGPDTPSEQSDYTADDFFGRGRVSGHGPYSLVQGRYGDLNADPLVRVGWDIRSGFLASFTGYGAKALVFPMQFDIGTAIQPVEHLTALVNIGARGRTEGIEEVFDDPSTPYLREAFVLVHELPYQAYLKAGRFTPAYGLRLDDHTSFIRRGLGLDYSLPEARVSGVEIGAAPNYPFLNASWFKSKRVGTVPDELDIFDVDAGWGTALNAGYRELGWSLGGSLLHRSRSLTDGGDQTAWGLYGVLNPWFYERGLPLTYQFEVDRAQTDRRNGSVKQTALFYQELSWLVGNGVNLLVGHNWEDPDREVDLDEAHRIHLGTQITPVPGFTLDARYRILSARRGGGFGDDTPSATSGDLFIQFHFWN